MSSLTIATRSCVTFEGAQTIHPVMQRIYAARGVTSMDQLQYSLQAMLPPQQLAQIDQAAALLSEAVVACKRMVVVGDFDADGATSTALAVSALRLMGAAYAGYCLPNRFVDGYGLSEKLIPLIEEQSPDLIITVDNGIAANAGVAAAKAKGWQVLVTDHHLPGEILPNADVIVNPNAVGDTFPSKCLAGVGVIFYVMCAARRALAAKGWFVEQGIEAPNMANFLDLVALGTVADLVPLDYNNRILVHQGLARMRSGHVRPGIQALLDVAGRDRSFLTASDLGFALAPRLNAAGRLEDMSLGVACLLSTSLDDARMMASRLDQLNRERRDIEITMKQEANAIVDGLAFEAPPVALCLYHEDWHQGVVGLVASRLKEQYDCPVIIFAKDGEGALKGSGRSVAGINLRDVLADLHAKQPELMSKFGGHAMAAGLSIAMEQLDIFKRAFVATIAGHAQAMQRAANWLTDGVLKDDECTMHLAKLIETGGPWGQQFECPQFHGQFELVSQRLVGDSHLKCTLKSLQSDVFFDAIYFNIDLAEWPNTRCRQVRCVYRLDVNRYQGRSNLQLILVWMEPVGEEGSS